MRKRSLFSVFSFPFPKSTGMQQCLMLMVMIFFFSSCLKEEDPVFPPDLKGDIQVGQIPMGEQYASQYFFDLGTNQIVRSNSKNDWDLAFECGIDGYRIKLNSSKSMYVWNTRSQEFELVTNEAGARWRWDVASGNLDSTGIGTWGEYSNGAVLSHKFVYVINRGKYFNGSNIGFKKVIFEGLQQNTFVVRHANLDGSEEDTIHIRKNEDYSFVYLSFENGGKQVTIAPPKNDWDLLFTQYTHIFSETPDNIPQPDTLIPYLVTGVLLNSYEVVAETELSIPFNDITFDNATNRLFSKTAQDIIGYQWKYYNFEASRYTVLPDQVYIIRDTEGYLYKLHFVGFYSSTGVKGYPQFEFQRL